MDSVHLIEIFIFSEIFFFKRDAIFFISNNSQNKFKRIYFCVWMAFSQHSDDILSHLMVLRAVTGAFSLGYWK